MRTSSNGLRIASIRGVPVYIGTTWPIIAVILVGTFGPQVHDAHPEWGAGAYLLAVVFAVLLLLSVLAHECAHAVMAQRCGYQVGRIVADLWGGHTVYETPVETPLKGALVAAVGPLTNGVIAALGYVALAHTRGDGPAELLISALTWSNTFVAVFNALPGLPLDGGFVIDAIVWKITGSRAKGLKAAGWCGRIVAVAIVIWTLYPLFQGHQPSMVSVMITLLFASFLWRGATTAVTVGANREFLGGISARQVIRPAVGVAGETPLNHLPDFSGDVVTLGPAGLPNGIMPVGAHVQVPLEQRGTVPVSALAQALPPGAVIHLASNDADIMAILPAFSTNPPPSAVVVTGENGRVIGVATLADVERALQRAPAHQ